MQLVALSLLLVLALRANAVDAFDPFHLKQLRDSGYRSCPRCDLAGADLRGITFSRLREEIGDDQIMTYVPIGPDLQGAQLRRAQLQNANLQGAQLQGARLAEAQLQDADLSEAQLQGAYLALAALQGANLGGANLKNADLRLAKLQGANLYGTQLQNANLWGAKLQKALLLEAQLQGASLEYAFVEGTQFAFADLTDALYAPFSPPPDSSVEGVRGLSTLRIPYDEATQQPRNSGLVMLRELLQNAGLRDLEREATYSIERAKTDHALLRWREKPLRAAEAVFRLIFFKWPVAYGLDPWRAFQILLGLWLALSFVYPLWIARAGRKYRRRGGLYRIWPSEQLVTDGGSVGLVTYGDVPERKRAERLEARSFLGRYGYALYFTCYRHSISAGAS